MSDRSVKVSTTPLLAPVVLCVFFVCVFCVFFFFGGGVCTCKEIGCFLREITVFIVLTTQPHPSIMNSLDILKENICQV